MNLKGIMMQFFKWDMFSGGLWNKMGEESTRLSKEGITAFWIPPAYKGTEGVNDTGYGVYDLFDLGEFDQKGTVPTKYGTKDELLRAIDKAHENGIEVYADIVLDHKLGADELEKVMAEEFNPDNRLEQRSGLVEIEAYTHYYFPGRNKKYSDFEWHWYHFTGIDFDETKERKGIFKFEGKEWEPLVDQENGNYEYLMGASVDLNHEDVKAQLIRWGKWFVETTKVDGFRLDAVKHMRFTFFNEWLHVLRDHFRKELFTVGEYWRDDLKALQFYLKTTQEALSLFDVPLHYKFHKASISGDEYDLRTMFEDTLVAFNPLKAVTFVDNHDSQPGQSLESWVEDWFKPSAYAMILLRRDGYPCIFYGDYYGIPSLEITSKQEVLQQLMKARAEYSYGEQHDYLDEKNCIGWTREGDEEHTRSGMAVLVSNGDAASKRMFVGKQHAGKTFYEMTGTREDKVTVEQDGHGEFKVESRSLTVWVPEDGQH